MFMPGTRLKPRNTPATKLLNAQRADDIQAYLFFGTFVKAIDWSATLSATLGMVTGTTQQGRAMDRVCPAFIVARDNFNMWVKGTMLQYNYSTGAFTFLPLGASGKLLAVGTPVAGYTVWNIYAGPSTPGPALLLAKPYGPAATIDIDFSWITDNIGFDPLVFNVSEIAPVTTNTSLFAYTSADGINYDSAAGSYSNSQMPPADPSATATPLQTISATQIQLNAVGATMSNNAAVWGSFTAALRHYFDASHRQAIEYDSALAAGTTRTVRTIGVAMRLAANVIKGLRLKANSGDISAYVSMYGYF